MSWCGGGEIRPTPGVECRTRAITASTLWPGNWPPSPGLAPCAILICIMSELTRYSVVTPNRPEATCLIAERMLSPFGSGLKRSASSPPSPVFDLPPIRFMAIASVVCASREIEPKLIAPVAKRLTISAGGFLGDLGKSDALDPGMGAGKILGDEIGLQPDGVKNLRAAIGLVGRDAHLGHHLQQALADRLDVALDDLVVVEGAGQAVLHRDDGFEREVRIDRLGAVAGETGEMMHFARFA